VDGWSVDTHSFFGCFHFYIGVNGSNQRLFAHVNQ
jgi:hypothetical protein